MFSEGAVLQIPVLSLGHLDFLQTRYCIILSCLALRDKVNIEGFWGVRAVFFYVLVGAGLLGCGPHNFCWSVDCRVWYQFQAETKGDKDNVLD